MGSVLVRRGGRLFIINLASGRGGGGGECANSSICGKCICAYDRLDHQQPLILFKVYWSGTTRNDSASPSRKKNLFSSRPTSFLAKCWDHFTFLGNCPPIPSLSQHFALSKA